MPAPPPPSSTGGPTQAELEAAFATTVHPVLTNPNYPCVDCHASGGTGSPPIADANVSTAFRAVWDNGKANLTTPANSRLVRRLDPDQHHCWSSDCVADSNVMETAISQWAQLVNWGAGSGGGGPTQQVSGLVSQNLTLADGFEDQGSERFSGNNLIAFYDFKDGTGGVVADKSGVAPAADLTLNGPTLMSSYGISVDTGVAIAPATTSRKLYDEIADVNTGTQQYSIEAWVTPADTVQEGPARIVSYSANAGNANFMLGQVQYFYHMRNRSTNTDVGANGRPELANLDQDLQARLQHVVVTYDRYRGRRIYVDTRLTRSKAGEGDMDADNVAALPLWNWNPNFNLALGNEPSGDRQWKGQIRLLAIYKAVLTDEQIQQNFDAGVGKRLLLRFDVSQWAGPGAFLEFVVTELDNYSYLFCQPALVSTTLNARVGGIRLMVNGQTPVTGQAFPNLDKVITQNREPLSPLCSVVPKDLGPASDVFTVDFEYLAGYNDPEPPTPVPPLPPRQFGAALPSEGLRDFARVNASMAAVTGVDALTPNVDATYQSLTQQMPPTYDLRTFASAQQVAITKLTLEYCDALVESPQLRSAFFGSFDFSQPPATAFASQAGRDQLTQAVVDHILGSNLTTQPSFAETEPMLNQLITDLTLQCNTTPCGADRTRTVAKAVCTAALASAAATVH